jgi:surface carbohydrate biosynthesis protein (TIGR04326 family)
VETDINLVGSNSNGNIDGSIVYWDSHAEESGELSLPKIVEQKREVYRGRFIDLLTELENFDANGIKLYKLFKICNLNYWEFMFSSEFTFQENSVANKFIKIYALIEILEEKNIKSLKLFSIEHEISLVLSFWCEKNSVDFRIIESKKVEKTTKLLKITLVQQLLGIRDIVTLLILNKKFVNRQKRNITNKGREITLLDYFDNFDSQSYSFKSNYWGELPEILLRNGFKINYLHFFTKNELTENISDAKKLVCKFNLESQHETHELVESYFDFAVFIKSIWIYIKINSVFFRSKNFFRQIISTEKELSMYPITAGFILDNLLGRSAAKNAVHLALFENICFKIKEDSPLFYLMENQAWEKAAVFFSKRAGVKTMGVIHNFRKFWDFRFASLSIQKKRPNEGISLIPDLVFVNSASSYQEFLDYGFSQDEICEVEAVRYVQATSIQSKSKYTRQSPLQILVIGEYSDKVAIQQLNFLAQTKRELGALIKFVFRIHPSSNLSIPEQFNGVVHKSLNTLEQDLEDCDEVMAYSSSTAIIKVLQTNKMVRVYSYPMFFDGVAGLNVHTFTSVEDYIELIKQTLNNPQKKPEIFYDLNTNVKLQKWNKFISNLL